MLKNNIYPFNLLFMGVIVEYITGMNVDNVGYILL